MSKFFCSKIGYNGQQDLLQSAQRPSLSQNEASKAPTRKMLTMGSFGSVEDPCLLVILPDSGNKNTKCIVKFGFLDQQPIIF